jgi:catechol 2,3-dioxygenase-like lactoylglutathione lyase family enzyme
MNSPITGLHHVTAIASDPQTNLDFYSRVLGMRLVKKTINYDDPAMYHFYFGDAAGRPGTILTFFPIPRAHQGTSGVGQTNVTGLAVPVGALAYWQERLASFSVATEAGTAFGQPVLTFQDPDGLTLQLVETAESRPGEAWAAGPIPVEVAIRGVHHVLLEEAEYTPTVSLLTETMGFRHVATEGDVHRFAVGEGGPGTLVDVLVNPDGEAGRNAAGTVHHIAFRVADDESQALWRATLVALGYDVSPIRDRQYFHSIYYRERGGVLFELATDAPGFAIDETLETLGSGLMLPKWLEPGRANIQKRLPVVTLPEV